MARTSSRQVNAYRSKIDAWYIGLFVLVFAVMTGALITAWIADGAMRGAQASFIALGVIGFVAWITWGTSYTLDGHDLIVRAGPLLRRIDVRTITHMEPAHGFARLRSSPALSLDRLMIVYGAGKSVMISPADRDRFLSDLKSRQS
jgi:hypothetical protein